MKLGIYRHFKGNYYRVLGTARHSETLEEMVIYARVEHPDDVWVRPIAMFSEKVQKDGVEVDRFEFVGEQISK
jgi:hypothetical protein